MASPALQGCFPPKRIGIYHHPCVPRRRAECILLDNKVSTPDVLLQLILELPFVNIVEDMRDLAVVLDLRQRFDRLIW